MDQDAEATGPWNQGQHPPFRTVDNIHYVKLRLIVAQMRGNQAINVRECAYYVSSTHQCVFAHMPTQ